MALITFAVDDPDKITVAPTPRRSSEELEEMDDALRAAAIGIDTQGTQDQPSTEETRANATEE